MRSAVDRLVRHAPTGTAAVMKRFDRFVSAAHMPPQQAGRTWRLGRVDSDTFFTVLPQDGLADLRLVVSDSHFNLAEANVQA